MRDANSITRLQPSSSSIYASHSARGSVRLFFYMWSHASELREICMYITLYSESRTFSYVSYSLVCFGVAGRQ